VFRVLERKGIVWGVFFVVSVKVGIVTVEVQERSVASYWLIAAKGHHTFTTVTPSTVGDVPWEKKNEY
jgi:hypothetical protein